MAAAMSTPQSKPYQVIFIDDDMTAQTLIKEGLEHDNLFSVISAFTATEGRQAMELRNFNLDAVILDLKLPDAGGDDLLEWIKIMAPELPVIILSGQRTDDILMRCLERGANDFLDKPCPLDRLRDTLKHVIYEREQEKKRPLPELGIQADYPAANWVELTAPSEMEYLSRMNRFSEVLLGSRLPRSMCEDLQLAIEELGRNAIEWGNHFNPNKMFRISYCIFSDRIVLKVEDEGEGFKPNFDYDPSKDPLKHLNSRKEQGKRPGGYGVFLLRNMMDEIVYNEKGNVCVMTKIIPNEDA